MESTEKFIKIGCGSSFSVGLTDNGNLYGWGSNEDGQLGLSDSIDSISKPEIIATSIKSFSCGYHHIAIINSNGQVLTAGEGVDGKLGRVGNENEFKIVDLDNLKAEYVACGGQTTFIGDEDGQVYVAGSGDKGQLGLGPSITSTESKFVKMREKMKSISAGFSSSFGIGEEGSIYAWGNSKYGIFGQVHHNIYTPIPLNISHQGVMTLVGGWNSMILMDTTKPVSMSSSSSRLNLARKRRKEMSSSSKLPPLNKSLEKDVLEELRKVIRTNSLKKSTEFNLIDSKLIEQQHQTADDNNQQEQAVDMELTNSSPSATVTPVVDVNNNINKTMDNTVTGSKEVIVNATVETITEESEYETETDTEDNETGNEIEYNHPSTEKIVKIDEDKNEEQIYSDWGEQSQVNLFQVKFSPFKAIRKSFRSLIGDGVPIPPEELDRDSSPRVEKVEKSKKSKACIIL